MSGPNLLSRRDILQTAAALGVTGALVAPTTAHGAEPAFATESGLVSGKMKKLKFEEIPGLLSKAQVAPHYTAHYGGALKRFTAVEEQLEKLVAGKEPLGGDAYNALQRDKLSRMNSVLLHELYFDNLTPKPPEPKGEIRAAIAKRFGSQERWEDDFKACCTAAAGWAILARDMVNGKLYNVASDLHEVGVIWLGQPIVVCDVYEHAFYVDYQNKKADYVAKFTKFLDWDEINRRWLALAK